nr:unnamed protein product [Digitaria exilis]
MVGGGTLWGERRGLLDRRRQRPPLWHPRQRWRRIHERRRRTGPHGVQIGVGRGGIGTGGGAGGGGCPCSGEMEASPGLERLRLLRACAGGSDGSSSGGGSCGEAGARIQASRVAGGGVAGGAVHLGLHGGCGRPHGLLRASGGGSSRGEVGGRPHGLLHACSGGGGSRG